MVAQNSTGAAKKKPRDRPFPKGVSGNPGGRPKSERTFLVERYGEDAASLHDKLEKVLIPAYYRDRGRFLDIMRHAIALNGAFFSSQRMLLQYVLNAYFE